MTWDSRNGTKWHKDGLKLRQRQRKAQIQWENANSDMVSSSIHKTIGFEIQTRDIRNPFKRALLSTFWTIGGQSFFPLPPTKLQKRLLVHHVKTRTANVHPLRLPKPYPVRWHMPAKAKRRKCSHPGPLPPLVRNARASLLRAAYTFQVTWSERNFSWPFFSDTSPKCIDREGLWRRHTRSRQSQTQTRQSSPVKSLQWNQQTKNPVRLQT